MATDIEKAFSQEIEFFDARFFVRYTIMAPNVR